MLAFREGRIGHLSPAATPTPIRAHADERFLRVLIERIRKGTCVLFLGEGVALDPGGSGQHLSAMLARHLASDPELAQNPRLGETDNLRHVTQLYYQLKRDRDELALAVKDFYSQFAELTTDFHRDIASLPFKLCVSTTHDDLLYTALKERGKHPLRSFYNFRKANELVLPEPTPQAPIVYHLFGYPGDQWDWESLVLTENDLIKFMVNVVKGSPALPDRIRGYLADADTSFLFVGFGFQHWRVRLLLHVLSIFGHTNKSLALEDSAFFDNPELTQTIAFFSDEHAIEFQDIQWGELASKLAALYAESAGQKPPAPAEPAPGAPIVFISYASEDTEAVEQLAARLAAAGIAVWRDKQNLRGGDNWDRVLLHVIEKQVNYVLVAQSKAMLQRKEGVFYEEIHAALKRMGRMREGLRFVLPVKLEPCAGLPELKALHELNISSDAGFQGLVEAIRDDWKQQK